MVLDAAFTPREVAELSGAPKRTVEKAIERGVLRARVARGRLAKGRAHRTLPTHAVAYAAILAKLDLKLSIIHQKRLFLRLARIKLPDISRARIELAPALEIDVGRLIRGYHDSC